MKNLIVIFISFILASCVVSYNKFYNIAPPEIVDNIPLGSNKIIVKDTLILIENYNTLYKLFLVNSYNIDKENKDVGYISASSIYGDAAVRINAVCEDKEISFTAEWMPGSGSTNASSFILGVQMTASWNTAQWHGKDTRSYPANCSGVYMKMYQFANAFGKELIYTEK